MFVGCSQGAWVRSQRMWVWAELYSQLMWARNGDVLRQDGLRYRVVTPIRVYRRWCCQERGMLTFSGKGHVKRNKRVSNVLPQPEGHLEIFMAAFCRLNRSNPWRRFADTPQVSATCGCTSRAKYSSMRSASGTFSVSRSSGSSSGWPSLSRQMMAASSRSERVSFCAEAGSFRPACNVLAGRCRRDSAGKGIYTLHDSRYRCSAHFSPSASF
jgi:hypothetical protein